MYISVHSNTCNLQEGRYYYYPYFIGKGVEAKRIILALSLALESRVHNHVFYLSKGEFSDSNCN